MAKDKPSFEKSLARLEELVKLLEKGEAPLAESLAIFEEGTALVKDCTKMLDEAQQKVVMLRRGEDGNPEELPFDE
ncbi:MAG: exodeoxyribonuclease VII small subunit [Oscillospiraceae bacterium]|jgi:exodeoxyribonuclease VII small subunit|nr:exodeoxyribonuclease VII small subunit [Oscillospiraceae bacterium]